MSLTFSARVLAVVRRIPVGRVATYGDVAALAGRPGAARAVGNIMRGCARPDVPCHRVIAANGRLGGYGGNETLKRALLVAEGITVSGSSVRNLAAVRDRRVAAEKQSRRPTSSQSGRRGQPRRATQRRAKSRTKA
jgi:O-6-methylguanine DNA methyltransferase